MRNKKFSGKLLAVMLSVSMAVSVGAAEFGDGTGGGVFTDAAQETEAPDMTPGSSQTPTPKPGGAGTTEDTGTPGITGTPEMSPTPEPTSTPGQSETPEPTPAPGQPETPEPTSTPGQPETPGLTPTPGQPETPGLTPTPGQPETPGLTPTPGQPETPGLTPTPGQPETPELTPTPGQPETPELTPTPELSPTPEPTPTPEITDLSKATVKLEKISYSYTGKALKPEVTVEYKKTVLKAGLDYTVTYANSTRLGTATVTIKGKGSYTGTVKKTFKIVLGTPVLKSAVSAGYNAVKLTWNEVPGARSYNVYCKGGANKSWKVIASNVTATSYKHVSDTKYPLTTGTQYTYTVRAVNGKNLSDYDKTGKSVKPIPSTVKLGKVTSAAYNKQKITWNKVAGATGYVVYQRIDNSWKKIAATKELFYINTNAKDHPVVTGVTNTYTVRAYRKAGKTNVYSKYPSAGISGKALLDTPAISKLTKTSKGLKLEWKKISGAAGYVVQRYDSGKWVTKKTIKSNKTLNYTDTAAKKGKTYKYRIAAYCNVNGKPFYSIYSAVKSGKR